VLASLALLINFIRVSMSGIVAVSRVGLVCQKGCSLKLVRRGVFFSLTALGQEFPGILGQR